MIGKLAGLVLQQSLPNVDSALLAGKGLSGLDAGSAEMSRRLFLICSRANPQIKSKFRSLCWCQGGWAGRGLLGRTKGSSNFNFLHSAPKAKLFFGVPLELFLWTWWASVHSWESPAGMVLEARGILPRHQVQQVWAQARGQHEHLGTGGEHREPAGLGCRDLALLRRHPACAADKWQNYKIVKERDRAAKRGRIVANLYLLDSSSGVALPAELLISLL